MTGKSCVSKIVRKSTIGLALLAVIALVPLAPGVDRPQASRRPTIGLAIGGEGAVGFVQVGVLQWLEERHIPIDYIAGTSMGGFVGGVYAAGHSTQEITAFLQNIDWAQTYFLGEAPYQEKGNWNKSESESLALKELKLSSMEAFVPMRNRRVMIFPFLPRIVDSYSNLRSFDDLPTPFRCTAVDLAQGQVVVMDRGSLPFALGATMALPGLMDPVRSNGKVLAGGGPLPVEVARSMGAEIVIAVSLSSPSPSESELSFFQQVQRSLELAKSEADRREMKEADVVITVDTSHYSSTDINLVQQLLMLGYKAADQERSLLLRFELPNDEWQRYIANRSSRKVR
jgi:NTE family protein